MKFLIADTFHLERIALKCLLEEAYPDAHFEEVDNSVTLFKKAIKEKWDLIISDLFAPDKSGLDVFKQIKTHAPKIPILILSKYPAQEYAMRCIANGCAGYLTKESQSDELLKAVSIVLTGRKYLNLEVAELLASSYEQDAKVNLHENLSDREYQIFKMLVDGEAMGAIAAKLSLSINTVRSHKVHIRRKMNLETDADLINYGIENNLV